MHCKHCGNKLSQGAKFCGNCGQKVEFSQTIEQPSMIEYSAQFTDEVALAPIDENTKLVMSNLAKKILTNAIVGLAVGVLVPSILLVIWILLVVKYDFGGATLISFCALISSIVALVLTNKALRGANRYADWYGSVTGKALVGKIMSIPAKIINIFFVVLNSLIFFESLLSIGY